GQRVVVTVSEQYGGRKGANGFVEADVVIASEAEDLHQPCIGDGWSSADHGDRSAVDPNRAGAVAAEDDGVVLGISQHSQKPWARLKERGHREHLALFERFKEKIRVHAYPFGFGHSRP